MSIDPDVAETGQPYAYTGDDPLNATDPLGLSGGWNPGTLAYARAHEKCRWSKHGCVTSTWHKIVHAADKVRHAGAALGHAVKKHWRGELQIAGTVLAIASVATGVGALAGASELGAISGALGAASGATDLPSCISGNGLSCVGAATGIAGGVGGLAGAGISTAVRAEVLSSSSGTAIASGLSGSLGFSLGSGATAFDVANDLSGR